MHQRWGDLFPRSEVRERSLSYVEGLLSHCERKNSWQVAECAGEASPYGMQYLLVRRSVEARPEYAFYFTYAQKRNSTLKRLVSVAGRRWAVESAFQMAKSECGLDHYEVRHWQGWYRHITLSMVALAVLTVLRAREKKLLSARFLSAYRKSGICSLSYCAGVGSAPDIFSRGLTGDDDTNPSPSSSTTKDKTLCLSLLNYNCSTRAIP